MDSESGRDKPAQNNCGGSCSIPVLLCSAWNDSEASEKTAGVDSKRCSECAGERICTPGDR